MDKKTQQILLFAGVGVVAYLWWKKRNGSSFDAYNYASGKKINCNIIRYDCVGREGIATTLVPTPDGTSCMCPTSSNVRY